MTLEERLAKRLREWQREAAKLRSVIGELHQRDEARASLEKELGRLDSCIGDLARDLSARNDTPQQQSRKPSPNEGGGA